MARFVGMWTRALNKRPLLVNTATYATFYAAAELSQQTFNKYCTSEKPDIDWASATNTVLVGSVIYPSTLLVWYRFLDTKFPGTTIRAIFSKLVLDQSFMTPILLATFFSLNSLLEGKNVQNELQAKFKTAFIANQIFWVPGQTINFYFVPGHLRVAYISVASFLWINVLCFIKRQKIMKEEEMLEEEEMLVNEEGDVVMEEENVVKEKEKINGKQEN